MLKHAGFPVTHQRSWLLDLFGSLLSLQQDALIACSPECSFCMLVWTYSLRMPDVYAYGVANGLRQESCLFFGFISDFAFTAQLVPNQSYCRMVPLAGTSFTYGLCQSLPTRLFLLIALSFGLLEHTLSSPPDWRYPLSQQRLSQELPLIYPGPVPCSRRLAASAIKK